MFDHDITAVACKTKPNQTKQKKFAELGKKNLTKPRITGMTKKQWLQAENIV